jgi:transposase InsO family protein
VQSDNGSEFFGNLQEYLSAEGIKQIFSRPYRPTTQAHVERVNGTIKQRVARHMEENDTRTYLPVLQDLVSSYNNSVHGTTKLTPEQAFNDPAARSWVRERVEKQALSSTKGRKVPPLAVGDRVRVAERTKDEIRRELSQLGRRSLLPQWSREVYTVKSVSQPKAKPGRPVVQANTEQYRLRESSSVYKRHDLQRVEGPVVPRAGRQRRARPRPPGGAAVDDEDDEEDAAPPPPPPGRRPRRHAAVAGANQRAILHALGVL